MKNNWIKVAAAVTAIVCFTGVVQAIPITGNIGFSGSVQLNSGNVATAVTAVNWFGTQVTPNSTSGAFFTEFGSAGGQPVTIATPWNFSSGGIANFWSVGSAPTFTFNLSSSNVAGNDGTFLNVLLFGTVSASGFDTTAFTGTFQVANPPANGITTFTERLSFTAVSVPDGGTTVMLLGGALMGLGLLKRKLSA